MTPNSSNSVARAQLCLLLLFLISLPLLNPWVRGDGVGYYAFARAPLIQHNLDFENDYLSANASFREGRLDENGRPKEAFRTATGHLENHFTVGPAILWSPFLILTHIGVLIARALGSHVPADGFSSPYRIAMAVATACYGFLALLLSFRIALRFVALRWALLATLAIWFASSLPVYMYFNPSWSHAHSAFMVALFIWYWLRTRPSRTYAQWTLLAAIAGLMLNVYYINAMILMVLLVEALPQYFSAVSNTSSASHSKNFTSHSSPPASHSNDPTPQSRPTLSYLLTSHAIFFAVLLVSMLPTLITRYIVYGSPFASGYIPLSAWLWRSPVFFSVLFSSNHGLLAWTPILLLSIAGLFIFWRMNRPLGAAFLAALSAFYFLISCYPDWAGISSFGNRFFVSLTALFILGLAVSLQSLATLFHSKRTATLVLSAALAIFSLWNAGLMFQWGSHLIPARGNIDMPEMARNQFTVVPQQIGGRLHSYLFKRKALMQQIEDRDLQQMKSSPND